MMPQDYFLICWQTLQNVVSVVRIYNSADNSFRAKFSETKSHDRFHWNDHHHCWNMKSPHLEKHLSCICVNTFQFHFQNSTLSFSVFSDFVCELSQRIIRDHKSWYCVEIPTEQCNQKHFTAKCEFDSSKNDYNQVWHPNVQGLTWNFRS